MADAAASEAELGAAMAADFVGANPSPLAMEPAPPSEAGGPGLSTAPAVR